jgi:hypothetical protein
MPQDIPAAVDTVRKEAKNYSGQWAKYVALHWILSLGAAGTGISAAVKAAYVGDRSGQTQTVSPPVKDQAPVNAVSLRATP